jgi:hypothetical protein
MMGLSKISTRPLTGFNIGHRLFWSWHHLHIKGMQTRAIEDLQKSIELDFTSAYGNLGWTYFDIGDLCAALENFDADCHYRP